MANRRNFFFANPPFKILANHLAQDEDFITDARAILDLEPDAFTRLSLQIKSSDTFLDRKALNQIVVDALGDKDQARNIASIIFRIGGVLHDADIPASKAMYALGDAIKEQTKALTTEDRHSLIARLQALSAEPLGLAKHFKARRLVTATGGALESFQVICDIRPVFDQNKSKIEGAMPLAILRIAYSSADEDSEVAETVITEEQIDALELTISEAKRKLKSIKEFLQNQSIPMPTSTAEVEE